MIWAMAYLPSNQQHSIGTMDANALRQILGFVKRIISATPSLRAALLVEVALQLLDLPDAVLVEHNTSQTTPTSRNTPTFVLLARAGGVEIPRFVNDSDTPPSCVGHSCRIATDGHCWHVFAVPRSASPTSVMLMLRTPQLVPHSPAIHAVAEIVLLVGDLIPIHVESNWPQLDRLSADQRQTLELILAGHSEKYVARTLGKSAHTIHAHVRRVYKLARVNSKAELMVLMLKSRSTVQPATPA
jgi:DNA-binding CsgD family transcriptional regulator